MGAAAAAGVPLTIAGARTGLTGGSVPAGGWSVSLERFRKLEISRGSALAGAGVSLADVQAAAARTGQFYAPDPTERTASVGGTIATDASGSRSFRYGSTRRHVLALRAVLMDGSTLAVRRGEPVPFELPSVPRPATTKCTAGYRLAPGMDWIDLLCGSEGTLAIVTEAELQLLPAPAELLAGVMFFGTEPQALAAVDLWRALTGLRMLEFLDTNSLELLRGRYPEIPTHATAALLIETEETETEPFESAGGMLAESWFGASARDRERFRAFRHALPEAVNATVRGRGFLKLGSDFAVPLGRNREMLAYYRERLAGSGLQNVIFGHIGDAHLHVNILAGSAGEFQAGEQLLLEFARRAVELGGTVSAEHGLGKRKAHLLAIQYSPGQIEAMRKVKSRLDPGWLLGRGNLFPSPHACYISHGPANGAKENT